ncbi:MAG TPA: hypothetical protein VLF40_03835 [Candidatus Saccharimonadales bacterium]|nr:hypothetical protein [Candidatus Saccharimonadales bacterium]
MSDVLLQPKHTYEIDPTNPLVVADIVRPDWRHIRGERADVMTLAYGLAPYVQPESGQSAFQEDMVRMLARELPDHGYSVAYEHVGNALAFALLNRERSIKGRKLAGYVLKQFGVTARFDLREAVHDLGEDPGLPGTVIGTRRLHAAGALAYTLFSQLPAGARVSVRRHPDDTRDGFFFIDVLGFRPADPGGGDRDDIYERWRRRDVLVVDAAEACKRLLNHPDFAFLRPSPDVRPDAEPDPVGS